VTAAAHGEREPVIACEVDCARDVLCTVAPDDQRRPAIDHLVPDPASFLVLLGALTDECSAQSGRERFQGSRAECHLPVPFRECRRVRMAGEVQRIESALRAGWTSEVNLRTRSTAPH
jgi:hypothetical protein